MRRALWLLLLLVFWIPIPRAHHVSKTGVVVDAGTGKPLKDAVLVFGVQRECGGLGGTVGGRHHRFIKAKTNEDGRFRLSGILPSLDWFSPIIISGCGSSAQEYVCKPGYAPKTTGGHWYERGRLRKYSPITRQIALSTSTASFRYTDNFDYTGELKRDCQVEIDYGLMPEPANQAAAKLQASPPKKPVSWRPTDPQDPLYGPVSDRMGP